MRRLRRCSVPGGLLILLLALTVSCSDDDDPTAPTCAAPAFNLAGSWTGTSTTTADSCGDDVGQVENFTFTVSQASGSNDLTISDSDGSRSARLCGSTFTYSWTYPEDGGTTTDNGTINMTNADAGSGTSSWKWTDQIETCTGTDQVQIERSIPAATLDGEFEVNVSVTDSGCFGGQFDSREGILRFLVDEDEDNFVTYSEATNENIFNECGPFPAGQRSGDTITSDYQEQDTIFRYQYGWDLLVAPNNNAFAGSFVLTVVELETNTLYCAYREDYQAARCDNCYGGCASPASAASTIRPIPKGVFKRLGTGH